MAELKKICQSKLNRKIISFFYRHPSSLDTARGIATWLNHDYPQVSKALNYLVQQKILTTHRTGSTTAYCLTQNQSTLKEIKKILDKNSQKGVNDVSGKR